MKIKQWTSTLECIIIIAFVVGCLGCAPETRYIDTRNDEGDVLMVLDYRDFERAADGMIQDLVASGRLKNPDGGRYVLATGEIINDTMQRIDTDQLMAKIEEELMNSGQVVLTSAVGAESSRDDLIQETRELRNSQEFDQSTVSEDGQLVAPDLSISGKIVQRDLRYDRNETQVEYYFQLQISEVASGLRYWQKEVFIGKRGGGPTW